MKKIILFIIAGCLMNGCVPLIYNSYHMSFEAIPNIKVRAFNKEDITKLKSQKKIAVSYELIRDKYTVEIAIDINSKRPSSIITAKDYLGTDLTIIPNSDYNECGGFDFLTSDSDANKNVRYEWWGFVKEECIKTEANKGKHVFTILVVNSEDEILGKESLPFVLIHNGSYIEYDAI